MVHYLHNVHLSIERAVERGLLHSAYWLREIIAHNLPHGQPDFPLLSMVICLYGCRVPISVVNRPFLAPSRWAIQLIH